MYEYMYMHMHMQGWYAADLIQLELGQRECRLPALGGGYEVRVEPALRQLACSGSSLGLGFGFGFGFGV